MLRIHRTSLYQRLERARSRVRSNGSLPTGAFEIAQIMGWSDICMAVRYTHATGDGIRRAMQLLTSTGAGKGNGKVLQLQNWTDTKVPTSNGNGQQALPVSA